MNNKHPWLMYRIVCILAWENPPSIKRLKHGKIVVDLPRFARWHGINPSRLRQCLQIAHDYGIISSLKVTNLTANVRLSK